MYYLYENIKNDVFQYKITVKLNLFNLTYTSVCQLVWTTWSRCLAPKTMIDEKRTKSAKPSNFAYRCRLIAEALCGNFRRCRKIFWPLTFSENYIILFTLREIDFSLLSSSWFNKMLEKSYYVLLISYNVLPISI